MNEPKERCESCGKLTNYGREKAAEYSRLHPIYGTDLSRPRSQVIEEVRNRLMAARGELSDVSFAFTGWAEQVRDVEGLLTCGLIALAYIKEQMEKVEERQREEALAKAEGQK